MGEQQYGRSWEDSQTQKTREKARPGRDKIGLKCATVSLKLPHSKLRGRQYYSKGKLVVEAAVLIVTCSKKLKIVNKFIPVYGPFNAVLVEQPG